MMQFKTVIFLAGAIFFVSGCKTSQKSSDVLYHGFSRIDPVAEEVIDQSWLIVSNGRIKKVGSGVRPRGAFAAVRDMTGLYASPGLVDAHAHITAGPHRIQILNGAPTVTIDSVDEITQFNATIALAFGVTTVRNPGGDPVANAHYDNNIKTGVWSGPEAFHAGAVIQPPPFGGNAFAYPTTDLEWNEEARRQAELGSTYFKLYTSLSEEQILKGIEAAHAHGLKAIAHLDQLSWLRAIDLGIDGLEHALPTSPDLLEPAARTMFLDQIEPNTKYLYRWFELVDFEGPLFQELVKAIVESGVDLNLTLLVNDIIFNGNDMENILSQDDLQYLHPAVRKGFLEFTSLSLTGWTPEDFTRADNGMEKTLEFARRLHEAGASIMIGTDGNGGSPALAREMMLHSRAGISNWSILRMVTSVAAERLGVAERVGRLTPGYEADIAFFKFNIADDVSNARHVAYIVNNGNEYAFDDLVAKSKTLTSYTVE